MKFQILQDNLKQGLFVVGHTASKGVNLPILHNVLIEAVDGNIKLTTTNLEIGVTCTLRGKVEEVGQFTVDAKILYDFISVLPNKKIDIELDGDYLKIKADNYQTKILGQSAEEYPLMPQIERNQGFSVDLQLYKDSLTQVLFAISNNDTRLELTGVYTGIAGNQLILATTDSYRLAEKKLKIKNFGDDQVVIIPAKTLQEVVRIASGSKNTVAELEVFVSENQVLFVYDNIELISKIIEGQFPDYNQIIPTTKKTTVKVESGQLVKAVKAASLFSKTGVNDINIDLPQGKGQLIISAVSGTMGENITELEAQVDGEDNGVVLNYRYLMDGLVVMKSEFIDIYVVDSNTPVVIKPEGVEGYLYIVMPIKQ